MSTDDRTELARDRTDLAEDRTVLAHERSFAGWVRTGMAAVGIGLGFSALFKASVGPIWIPKAIATTFLIVAMFIFISAERRACSIIRRLNAHQVKSLKPVRIQLLAWALVVATGALIAALWFLAE